MGVLLMKQVSINRKSFNNEVSEQDVQKAILQYLELCPQIAWAQRFNTGAQAMSYTSKVGAEKRRFVRFAFTGCSDILGQLKSGHLVAIECKRRGGKATDSQESFLRNVSDNNGLAIIATNVLEVAQAIEQFCKAHKATPCQTNSQ
ncbi:hypothetical protein CCP4SC76_6750008 [Gammaproteobacteria bacterium]